LDHDPNQVGGRADVALVPGHGARRIVRKDEVMSDRPDAYKPDGWRAITPRLFTTDVPGLVHFLRVVFKAKGDVHADRPSELRIDDAMVMVSDGGGVRESTAAFLYVYVPDADLTYRRAVAAGAEALETPADMPYGDRRATVRDPWGNVWQIATYGGRGAGP
jgi:PhnB protein